MYNTPFFHRRRTKIICTLGPASSSEEQIRNLVDAGMNVARLNFSHGSHNELAEVIKTIRHIENSTGKSIGILADLQGPKIRIGTFKSGSIFLKDGDDFTITSRVIEGNNRIVSTSYKNLPDDLSAGETILLNDGLVKLKVIRLDNQTDVVCNVIYGGELTDHKGINLPETKLSIPSLTEKDIEDLKFILTQDIDFIALSFVRQPDDISQLRKYVTDAGKSCMLVSKIEKPEALINLDKIIELSDVIMIARGDLGVELPLEKVPKIQSEIIKKCNQCDKAVITATQMLESMIINPRPTRAEVTDVSLSVSECTDAVMLSGETAVGKYPSQTVRIMDRIIREAEKPLLSTEFDTRYKMPEITSIEDAISHSSCHAAEDIDASYIVAYTQSGQTARLISKFRPRIPIIAFTPNKEINHRLCLFWGVFSIQIQKQKNIDSMTDFVSEYMKENNFCSEGSRVIITAGSPLNIEGNTNTLKAIVIE